MQGLGRWMGGDGYLVRMPDFAARACHSFFLYRLLTPFFVLCIPLAPFARLVSRGFFRLAVLGLARDLGFWSRREGRTTASEL